jgi:glucose-1-phosphatase
MGKIKNIIFDLGGVILNIAPERTVEAFAALGLENPLGERGWFYHHDLFYLLEQGTSTPEEFRDHVRELLNRDIPDSDIDHAWCAMILDIPSDRVEYLQTLKDKFRIFLLSNTNEIHRQHYFRDFESTYGFVFSELFEQDYYSHRMGMRKPNPAIFKQVLENHELIPGETLFIDDSEENIKAASGLGIQALHLEPGTLNQVLPDFLMD